MGLNAPCLRRQGAVAARKIPRYAKAGECSSWPSLFRVTNFTLLTSGVVVRTEIQDTVFRSGQDKDFKYSANKKHIKNH